jgi:hypothetical protein
MVPAQERLRADDATGTQVELRLVVEIELAALQRPPCLALYIARSACWSSSSALVVSLG